MTMKCTCSHRRQAHVNLAHTKAKKSILDAVQANLIINRTKKFNQISNGGEEAIKKFNLFRCQHKKKKKKKNQICKGKSPSNNQMEIHKVPTIHFQDEIMMDILCRLPMRSILRFKCVSKLWKSLIDDPYFKRTHYIHNRDNQKVLFAERLLDKDETYSFYTSSLSMVEDKQKLDGPTSCNPVDAIIFCSCDGLVLIRVCSRKFYEELLLWNPSTRESILLPHPEFPLLNYVFGMEYTSTSEGYKILAVNLNGRNSIDISVECLSRKSPSWRKIGYPTDIERPQGFRDCGTDNLAFLHGAFHWLGKSPSGYHTIISLNISNEVYGEVPLLKQMYYLCPLYFFVDHGVSVLRGMLCFYSAYNLIESTGTFKLWIMKDYGVRESWTNFIKIKGTDLFLSARPLYMFADCQVLLHFRRFTYFSSNFTTSARPFDLCPECDTAKSGVVFAESFISPTSLTY